MQTSYNGHENNEPPFTPPSVLAEKLLHILKNRKKETVALLVFFITLYRTDIIIPAPPPLPLIFILILPINLLHGHPYAPLVPSPSTHAAPIRPSPNTPERQQQCSFVCPNPSPSLLPSPLLHRPLPALPWMMPVGGDSGMPRQERRRRGRGAREGRREKYVGGGVH